MTKNNTILIGGDLVINRDYDVNLLSEDVIKLFESSDYNILNLEAPVTKSLKKIKKTGRNIKSDLTSTLNVLNKLKVNIVTLANNHILDYGEEGLEDTVQFCEDNKINYVGAGQNIDKAAEPLIINKENIRIGIINIAENEWNSATQDTAGSYPLDIIENSKLIHSTKKSVDKLIVISHGGNEHYHYPSPRMVKTYRFFVDCGADVIVGHHTHCVSGYELYKNVPIFYSLGNFLFLKDKVFPDKWYNGLVLKLSIFEKTIDFEIIPIFQTKIEHKLILGTEVEKNKTLHLIKNINETIENPKLLKEKWDNFVDSKSITYLKHISPLGFIKNRYIKGLFFKSGLYKYFLNENYLLESLNRLRCEAHYDIMKDIYSSLLSKKR